MFSVNRFFNDTKYAISTGISAVLLVSFFLSIFLIVKTFNLSKQQIPNTVVTLTGSGEVVAIPDVASFTYTISKVSETVTTAQEMATKQNNDILQLLKENGVDEKDIKTISYNIFPKYEWRVEPCFPGMICRGGENVLIGQEVSQTVQVKVRDTAKAGQILSMIGQREVANLSGLQFTIDDESVLRSEAREKAIADAKQKAEVLAKQLGVKIKRVVSFSEDDFSNPWRGYGMGGDMMMVKAEIAPTPEIMTGENTITSKVYITFEIK
jgi:uncharacterized protein YggE